MKQIHFLISASCSLLITTLLIFSCSSNEPNFGDQSSQYVEKTTEVINDVEEKEEVVSDLVEEETTTVEQWSEVGEIFHGNHNLSKISDDEYLYLYTAGTDTELQCSFIWETNDGNFQSSYIDYSDITFEVDSTINTPYIKFHWDQSSTNRTMQLHFYHDINYAVVVTPNANFHEILKYDN